jgi:uncharacterized protein
MICNSTPLICLAKINQIELLKKLFDKIFIPNSVKEEILIEGKPGFSEINKALNEGWIKIMDPKKYLNLGLGKGEDSAISLASERNEMIIIDDGLAIKYIKSLDLDFIRTTGVIISALQKRILNKKQTISIINDLIYNGYYISPRIYTEIINIIKNS